MVRIAKSLDVLRTQVNVACPNRSKASDGWIGDARHSKSKSDHNAGSDGIVQALDITHDPANGCDAKEIWDDLRREGDQRFGYMIWNRRIFNPMIDAIGSNGRPYNGSNPHTKHIHVSVHKYIDNTAIWAVIFADTPPPAMPPMDPALVRPLLKKGSKGKDVLELQQKLQALGHYKATLDSDFGEKTRKAVQAFQKSRKLTADGKVGPYTWEALFPDDAAPVTTPAPAVLPPVTMDAWYEPGHFPQVTDYAVGWLKVIEQFMAEPYLDAGTWAQGYGHNAASGVQPIPRKGGPKWTEEYATEVALKDLALQVHYLNSYVKVPLMQRHIDALALDIFQMGPGNWKKDKVLALLNAKDYAGAAQWMRDRVDSKGHDRRRNRQADIFLGLKPDPKSW